MLSAHKNYIIALLLAVPVFMVGYFFAIFSNQWQMNAARFSYFIDSSHYVDFSSYCLAHYSDTGVWPAPGSYSYDTFVFKKSDIDPASGSRRDIYQSNFDGGIRVEFILNNDGIMKVFTYPNI